jgi:hypothetical protein
MEALFAMRSQIMLRNYSVLSKQLAPMRVFPRNFHSGAPKVASPMAKRVSSVISPIYSVSVTYKSTRNFCAAVPPQIPGSTNTNSNGGSLANISSNEAADLISKKSKKEKAWMLKAESREILRKARAQREMVRDLADLTK